MYSHSLLLELKDHPLAKRWPPYLDPVFKNQRGVWDPDRWHLDRKRGETPVMGSLDTKGDLEPREAGGRRDREIRRERVGLEQDGEDLQQLVLSPQRRSFLGGCSSGSGLGEGEVSLRPEQPGKRVGSGRILARQERERGEEGDRGFRRGEEFRRLPGGREENKFGGFRGREREEEREGWGDDRRREGFYQHEDRERRGESREVRDGRGGMQDRHNNRSRRRQNEPEWMNECVSKSDVIELRGFDERKEVVKEPSPQAALPIALSLGLTKPGQGGPPPGLPAGSISVEDLEREQRDTKQQQHRERDNNNQQGREKNHNNHQREMNHMRERENNRQNGQNNLDILKNLGMELKNPDEKSFNYDQIIESMNLSSLLGGAPGLPDPQAHVKPAAQSRFSQFFNRGGGEQQGQDSRRSSIQDELLGANILKEINGDEGPVIRIPSPAEEERYFAPISPAAQTRAITNPLLDMINKGTNQQGHHRVQDLEEGIRRSLGLSGSGGHHQLPPHQQLQNQQAQDIFKAVQGHNMNNNIGSYMGHRQFQGKENREEQQQDSLSAFKKLVSYV